jgi:hypothetical protein
MTVSRVAGPKPIPSVTSPRPVELSQVKSSDTGLKLTSTANSITVSGTAKGPVSVNPWTGRAGSDYENTEDKGASLSLSFDHDKMPKFDTSAGYTEKNKWFFSHSAEVTCKKGQTAEQVLTALAAKVNANGDYKATVVARGDGGATLTVDRKR